MRFYDPNTGQISEIGSPELNPDLVSGKVKLPDTGVITSDMLKSVTPIEPVKPKESPLFPVESLNTDFVLPQEQEQSDIVKRTQSLIDQFTGKSEFQAQKEQEAGIAELTKTQQDLTSRLKLLQAEAQAIPLQIQQEFKGRGVTKGGIRPIEQGRLREVAIQSLAIGAQLEATRGNLTTALTLVDRAVAQKYDPIEARINANLQNLELLSKDPTLTFAQKRRLEAQQARQQKLKEENDLAKKNEEEARKKALEYAGIADALTLDEMSKAKTALEVAQIAERKELKTLEQQKAELEKQKLEKELGEKDLQFVSGTENQSAGVFDKRTGKFTPLTGAGIDSNNGKIVLSNKDSLKVNKELTTSDAYKAIRKAQDSLQFLTDFETKFEKYGLQTFPAKRRGELASSYQTTLLNLKEFFNLGVLNGPDLVVLEGIMPNPTKGLFKKFRGRASAVEAGIENMKQNIEKTLDDRFQSLMNQYGQYDESSLTNIKDLKRIYIEQKAKLNPKVSQMISENPNLSDDEILQIIQSD